MRSAPSAKSGILPANVLASILLTGRVVIEPLKELHPLWALQPPTSGLDGPQQPAHAGSGLYEDPNGDLNVLHTQVVIAAHALTP